MMIIRLLFILQYVPRVLTVEQLVIRDVILILQGVSAAEFEHGLSILLVGRRELLRGLPVFVGRVPCGVLGVVVDVSD